MVEILCKKVNGEDFWMIRDVLLWPVDGSSNQFVATSCDSSELCLAHQQMTGKCRANKQESQRQQERKARDAYDLYYARMWAYGYLKERLKELERSDSMMKKINDLWISDAEEAPKQQDKTNLDSMTLPDLMRTILAGQLAKFCRYDTPDGIRDMTAKVLDADETELKEAAALFGIMVQASTSVVSYEESVKQARLAAQTVLFAGFNGGNDNG